MRARSQKVTKAEQTTKQHKLDKPHKNHTVLYEIDGSPLWCVVLTYDVGDAMILCVEHGPAKLQMIGGFGKKPPWTWLMHYIHWNLCIID